MSLNRWIVSELVALGGKPLVAAVVGDGVSTALLDSNDPSQQWIVLGEVYKGGVQAAFYNETGQVFLSGPNNDASVTLSQDIDENSMWTVGDVGTGFALRPYRDSNMNLNVKGNVNVPGTSVLVWSWGGGQPNEVWDIISYAAVESLAASAR